MSRRKISNGRNLDPPQRRQRTLDAIKRLLLRESQVQPLILVFEDLHWIDSETQAFLDSLIDSLPTAALLLLVNYRPEYRHGWGSKTYYSQLRIDPLPPESAEELLQAVLGDDASLQPLKQLLIERTEGNPFFLEESVRTLGRNQSSCSASAASIVWRVRSRSRACQRPSMRCWPRASTGFRPTRNVCFNRRQSSARMCRSSCSKPSRDYRKKNSDGNWVSFKRLSFSTRRACFPISNTRSSMR